MRGTEITRDVGRRDGKPVLLIVGVHHGNERPSGEATMEFGFGLAENERHDPEIASLLGRVRVMLVPVVNVDGFVRNTRRTATNVDMNRNYGFGWGGSPPFQGSGPFSEPETRNMRDLIASRQVTSFLTVHTCLANMLYPPLQQAGRLRPAGFGQSPVWTMCAARRRPMLRDVNRRGGRTWPSPCSSTPACTTTSPTPTPTMRRSSRCTTAGPSGHMTRR